MKLFKVNDSVIRATSLNDAVKRYKASVKDSSIELDIALDSNADVEKYCSNLARKYGCQYKKTGSMNGWPTYKFTGSRTNLEKLAKEYGMDKEDFDAFVEDSVHDEIDRLKVAPQLKQAMHYAEDNNYQYVANICFNVMTMLKRTHAADSFHDDELDDLSDEERQAIEDYRIAIQNTTNPKLLELYAHILQEETEHLKELQSAKANDSVKDTPLAFNANTSMTALRSNVKNFINDPDKYWTSLSSNLDTIGADIIEWKEYSDKGLFKQYPNLKALAQSTVKQYYDILNSIPNKIFDKQSNYLQYGQKYFKIMALVSAVKNDLLR